MTTYTLASFSELADLPDWRVLETTAHAWYDTADLRTGARFAAEVAAAADTASLTPRISVLARRVEVALNATGSGSFTESEVRLARDISAIARNQGLAPDPAHALLLTVAIDALDIGAVRPFWQAVLGYQANRYGNLSDPDWRGPKVWFQQMDAPRPQRNRVHLDVYVPHDDAVGRVEAALMAGGRLVCDAYAPAWWVMADAEGNEACICTWQEPSQPPEAS